MLLRHIVTYVTFQLYQLADIIEEDTAEPVNMLVMATLRNTAGLYIFAMCFCFFLSSSSSFFPRLISVVAEWMSTILLHMVRP